MRCRCLLLRSLRRRSHSSAVTYSSIVTPYCSYFIRDLPTLGRKQSICCIPVLYLPLIPLTMLGVQIFMYINKWYKMCIGMVCSNWSCNFNLFFWTLHLVSTLIIVEKQSQVRYPTCMSIFSHNVAKGTEKRTTKNVQLVLQHCCKTSWIAMLRILPPMFKPVNNLICCQTGLMWVVKHTTLLFNSFWSNVARQVAHFLLPVFPYLNAV